jgi:hypothetical protein
MSEKNVGLVVEGDTDYDLLCALIQAWYGPNTRFRKLQPADSSPENGQGWKGVRRWCQQTIHEYGSLQSYCSAIEPRLDGIILQLDGDVVFERDVDVELGDLLDGNERRRQLRNVDGYQYDSLAIDAKRNVLDSLVAVWLSEDDSGRRELCSTIDEMETWIVASYDGSQYHKPPEYPIEALFCPADTVIGRSTEYHGIKVSRREGRLKKQRVVFRQFHEQLIAQWSTVRSLCSMAGRFEASIRVIFEG